MSSYSPELPRNNPKVGIAMNAAEAVGLHNRFGNTMRVKIASRRISTVTINLLLCRSSVFVASLQRDHR